MNTPVFSKTLKKAKDEFDKIHNFLVRDPVVKETLFTSNSKVYTFLRVLNVFFSFVVFIPIIGSFWNFNFPHFLGYLLSAFGVYLTWIFEWVTKSTILEEIRTITIIQISLHSVFGMWFEFYNNIEIYDFILHVTGGVWLVFLIFPIVMGTELIWTKMKMPFFYLKVLVITISIVMTLGVFWEISEFVSDLMFRNYPGYRLAQEDSLFDTMTDFIGNFLGAIIGSQIFWYTLKKLNTSRDIDSLLERMGSSLRDYVNSL
ncbi:membrane protein [Petrotoga sp. 9PWA.NaAc.5.4]|nr:membrane protein [Petrotoga sp. 9PWA.NaAc.5.4]